MLSVQQRNSKKMLPSESQVGGALHAPLQRYHSVSCQSSPPGLQSYFALQKTFFSLSGDATSLNSTAYDPLVILDTICRVKVGECLLLDETRSSFIAHQPSEQGYLNLTSPSASAVTAAPREGADDPEQV